MFIFGGVGSRAAFSGSFLPNCKWQEGGEDAISSRTKCWSNRKLRGTERESSVVRSRSALGGEGQRAAPARRVHVHTPGPRRRSDCVRMARGIRLHYSAHDSERLTLETDVKIK